MNSETSLTDHIKNTQTTLITLSAASGSTPNSIFRTSCEIDPSYRTKLIAIFVAFSE